MPLRILIADDHQQLREMLRALLESQPGWQVCAEASNGLEAVKKATEFRPEVVILDISMPEMDGLQAASRISSTVPAVPILIYTNYAVGPEAMLEAQKHGVSDVINKGTSPAQLIAAVAALQIQRPRDLPEQMAARAATGEENPSPAAPSDPDPKGPLIV